MAGGTFYTSTRADGIIQEGTQMGEYIRYMEERGITHVEVEAAEELRDIAQVLNITASTDKNIKLSMEAILRIADRLERRKNGEGLQTQSGTGKAENRRKDG